jgi:enoyl-CoA hydratase/carnithine racemase
MAHSSTAASAEIGRRDLFIGGAGAAALAVGLGRTAAALAQAGPGAASASPSSPPSAAPGKVVVERRGAVLLVGLDLTQAQDRLTPPAIIGLGKAYHQLEQDDGLRVAVLHSIGLNFCAGLDVPAFAAAQAAGILPPKDPDFINPLGLRPPIRTKPVVVAVQGRAMSVGDELVLAADIRVAAQDAVFGQLEVTRGVFPAGGATIRLTREAGWGNAMFHMLTGEEWNANEAYRLGLLQAVTPSGKQLDRAIEIANRIAAAAPLGVRATLASAHQAISSEDAALQALGPVFAKLIQSDDAKESARALQEHRAPVFRGT